MVAGEPPVTIAIVAGNESEGRVAVACAYFTPRLTMPASAEAGFAATYASRSNSWKPSTLMSMTCSA